MVEVLCGSFKNWLVFALWCFVSIFGKIEIEREEGERDRGRERSIAFFLRILVRGESLRCRIKLGFSEEDPICVCYLTRALLI